MTEATTSADNARRLRRRSTDAERKFWLLLRDRRLQGWKFRRQVPLGLYVADFYCAAAKLVVELDGGQHAIEENPEGILSELLRHMQVRSPLTLSLFREGRGDAVVDSLSPGPASRRDIDNQTPLTTDAAAKINSLSGSVMDERNSVPSPLAGEGQGEGETTPTPDDSESQ